jgi:acetyl-CoA carboxylase carboxyl transferase subunit alpha
MKRQKTKASQDLRPIDKVYLARHHQRPNVHYYINQLFEGFIELRGDRMYADDQAIVGGVALFDDMPVTVIGHLKGETTEEKIKSNFAMPHPEGYRKVIRLAQQAEKFKRPIITFIDTPGAYPGVGAEERGQAEAIGQCLTCFMAIKVPVIAVVIGEGGSGGALAIGAANHIIMLEHSVYSILSPEGFASIIYKDASKANIAASLMKLTADDLLNFEVIDEIIKEPVGGAHKDPSFTIPQLNESIRKQLKFFMSQDGETIERLRYEKFCKMGHVEVAVKETSDPELLTESVTGDIIRNRKKKHYLVKNKNKFNLATINSLEVIKQAKRTKDEIA